MKRSVLYCQGINLGAGVSFAGCGVSNEWSRSMIRSASITHDLFLASKDLDICQRAFDAILVEMNAMRDTYAVERAAAIANRCVCAL